MEDLTTTTEDSTEAMETLIKVEETGIHKVKTETEGTSVAEAIIEAVAEEIKLTVKTQTLKINPLNQTNKKKSSAAIIARNLVI